MIARLFVLVFIGAFLADGFPSVAHAQTRIAVDDFESYGTETLPTRWRYLEGRDLIPMEPRLMRPKERFTVMKDGNNHVLRVHTDGEAVHLTLGNGMDWFSWDLGDHPRLAWDWRALSLPVGAREDQDSRNDTGAAVYVVYKMEGLLIKRPKIIKYSYSSSLPVGSVASYGKLKVLVVSSAVDGIGEWRHIERDVVADYRMLFGEDPPDRPLSLRLWGDSDNTRTVADVDFDNIVLLPAKAR